MRRRFAIVFLAIALYSVGAFSLNTVVLPAAGINGLAHLNTGSFDFLGPSRSDPVDETDHKERIWGAGRTFSLWLRPFGVHRPDVNDVWWAMGSFSVLGTVATTLLFLFPKRVAYVSKVLVAEPLGNHLLNIMVGLLAYGVGFALLRLSWLTIVGMPFIPFLVGGVWLVTMSGIVAVSFTLGRMLLRRTGLFLPPLAEALVGLWLLFVTSMLPLLGWAAGGLAAALGFGVLLQTRFGTRQRWTLDPLDDAPREPEPLPDTSKIVPLRRAR